jgi:hypothetical protein
MVKKSAVQKRPIMTKFDKSGIYSAKEAAQS